jgi:hypothetical protein
LDEFFTYNTISFHIQNDLPSAAGTLDVILQDWSSLGQKSHPINEVTGNRLHKITFLLGAENFYIIFLQIIWLQIIWLQIIWLQIISFVA